MMKKLSIDDFKNLDNFTKLQKNFMSEDFVIHLTGSVNFPIKALVKEDFYITFQSIDEISEEGHIISTKIEKYYFYKDYLTIEIPELSKRYEEQITDTITKYYLADSKERRNYVFEQRHNLNKLYRQVDDFSFINNNLFESLKSEITKALEFIYDDSLVDKEISRMGKIVVNVPEIDLINIMMKLADEGFIKVYNDVELANIIENNFYIFEGKDIENKPIKNCYKKINGFRNKTKPNYKSLDRIRELFSKI